MAKRTLASVHPSDDWEERTVVEPGPSLTVADLHRVLGRLAAAVRWLAVTVAALTIVTGIHLWVIW